MHPSQIPEKPLQANVGKIEETQRTYFFERDNGTTFFTTGREAWSLIKRPTKVMKKETKRMKFLGSSNGQIFQKAVRDSHKVFREQGLSVAQEVIRKGESDELEAARGNMVYPPNYDMVDRGGNPINIASLGSSLI